MTHHGIVDFRLRLPIEFKQEGDWIIASCPMLDVHSQGRSEDEAERNIIEAIELFIESCVERGVFISLNETDFYKVASKPAISP